MIARFGSGAGAFTTAALLYFGAAISGVAHILRRPRHAAMQQRDRLQLVGVALVGAAIAPALFAWGLQHAGATAGSLLLNLEAVFTMLLARVIYRESLTRQAASALVVMTVAGIVLVLDSRHDGSAIASIGVLALTGATLFWALDNTLTRRLSHYDPLQIVTGKSAIGVVATVLVAGSMHEQLPRLLPCAALIACGVVGYGTSLRLYLLAQRQIGASRTASIFATAPFIGATCASLLEMRIPSLMTVFSGVLFATGVALHLAEHHAHRHRHQPLEHEHAHRHDDGHHGHHHEPPVSGEHSHRHRHENVEHEHEHGLDLHHDHHG